MLTILTGDALEMLRTLPDESVNCCVTSPPYYGLRDYGVDGQIGLESTPEQYIERLVAVFREVRRVLRKDGTCWVNIGDSYSATRWSNSPSTTGISAVCSDIVSERNTGLPDKNLIGIPWMLAFALRADGWYLRQDIIWAKPNPMPESVRDRCTKSHEYIFLLTKSARYWYDAETVREPYVDKEKNGSKSKICGMRVGGHGSIGKERNEFYKNEGRNKRSVWTINTNAYSDAHFATFPPELPRICILAGCPIGGTVLDPFAGSGTTGKVALELGRKAVLIELNPKYVTMIEKRCKTTIGMAI